jgi:hypothetical protein
MEIFSHSKTTNREGQVVATGGYDLKFGFVTGHSGYFFLIFCSHTRQIRIFTEINQLTIDYRFFIFFYSLLFAPVDANDVGNTSQLSILIARTA